MIENKF